MNNAKNHLENEKSPYLLQHAKNPVNWYPWNNWAFEKAKKENKPIFLSIGYSTCHWCHVMAHESFEDQEVAEFLNKNFICIKVDREERPDIDGIYMSICQLMTGSGGWPLSIFMTPDKKPFFTATYIPKNNRYGRIGLLELLPQLTDLWNNRRYEIENITKQLKLSLENYNKHTKGNMLSENILKKTFEQLKVSFDKSHGGFGHSPKFPIPHILIFLLRYWYKTKDKNALDMVKKTLDEMRYGGIYDHIGFGFHRYSTDQNWFLPHFEKMLYDQALLAIAYTEAYQITKKNQYKQTVYEILDYVCRVLTSPEGGFYSAEDADSEGEEGKFYLWSYEEISNILKNKDFEFFKEIFDFEKEGNLKSEINVYNKYQNIICRTSSFKNISDNKDYEIKDIEKKINSIRKKLFISRESRVHPNIDDKILTDWNGLMIAAFAIAAQAFNEDRYIKTAEKAASFILKNMYDKDLGLYHRYREKESAIPGNLNDYSFLIFGLLSLYQTTFSEKYFQYALDLIHYQIDHFWDNENSGFYFISDKSESLLIRKKDVYDGAIPSGNSISLLNLITLSRLSGNSLFEDKAYDLIRAFSKEINNYPASYTQFLIGLDFLFGPSYEVVIAGEYNKSKKVFQKFNNHFLPNKVVIFRPTENISSPILKLSNYIENYFDIKGKPAIYICSKYVCKKPVTKVKEAINFLKEK